MNPGVLVLSSWSSEPPQKRCTVQPHRTPCSQEDATAAAAAASVRDPGEEVHMEAENHSLRAPVVPPQVRCLDPPGTHPSPTEPQKVLGTLGTGW